MRDAFSLAWAAARWLLLMFMIAPAVQAPLVARPTESPKPIRVWTAVASWYGEDFNGQPTASGETYDMLALTAAHPTLPFGSVVRVVHLRSGRSQLVRINDRGPYVDGRGIDLSYLVARRLGMQKKGVSRVRLELLEVPRSR